MFYQNRGEEMRSIINSKLNNESTTDIKHAVIYARYSSSSQSEQSIDGQLRVCKEYAEKLGYKVINEYVDRAKTGTNANRPAFQNMIADSEKGQFQAVIVYMVDRFARSKEDSVVFKSKLRRNGVRVLSASEQISDSDEGFLVEGLLEMFAEQFSSKLSKRIKTGIQESIRNGTYTGGNILYGYKVIDKRVYIDEDKAPAIRYAFMKYAAGTPKKEVVEELNKRGYRTNKGTKFTINSFQDTLRNVKYIGINYIKGVLVEDSYPVMIDEETFNSVQKRLDSNRQAPAANNAKARYLLYGKAFCGECGEHLTGKSGTGKLGGTYNYYLCTNKLKKHGCNKKNESKDALEKIVVDYVSKYVLAKPNSERIADLIVAEYKRNINTSSIKELEHQINDLDKQLDGLVNAMSSGTSFNSTMLLKMNDKANDITSQKEFLSSELSKLKLAIAMPHTKDDIINSLAIFAQQKDDSDIEYQCRLVDRLINTVFVFDDKVLIYFNIIDNKPITLDMLPNLDAEKESDPYNSEGVRFSSVLVELTGVEHYPQPSLLICP